MYCTQCGASIPDSARFCPSCGKPSSGPAPSPEIPAYASPPRKLRRIVAQKKIAGVCAGFAEYFDTDITVMRVIWVALLLLPPHLGLFGYIVAWAVLPKS
jgi:phage shock protein C